MKQDLFGSSFSSLDVGLGVQVEPAPAAALPFRAVFTETCSPTSIWPVRYKGTSGGSNPPLKIIDFNAGVARE
jgi:hypothetical protein